MVERCACILIWRIHNHQIEFFMTTPGGPLWKNQVWWNFPKGHIEENEDTFSCALREFHEETGVINSKNKI